MEFPGIRNTGSQREILMTANLLIAKSCRVGWQMSANDVIRGSDDTKADEVVYFQLKSNYSMNGYSIP